MKDTEEDTSEKIFCACEWKKVIFKFATQIFFI